MRFSPQCLAYRVGALSPSQASSPQAPGPEQVIKGTRQDWEGWLALPGHLAPLCFVPDCCGPYHVERTSRGQQPCGPCQPCITVCVRLSCSWPQLDGSGSVLSPLLQNSRLSHILIGEEASVPEGRVFQDQLPKKSLCSRLASERFEHPAS